MSILPQAGVRVIGEPVGFQIEDGDGLLITGLSRSITVVQDGQVSPVRTQRQRGGKTIGPLRPPRHGRQKYFAGWKRNRTAADLVLSSLQDKIACEYEDRNRSKVKSQFHSPLLSTFLIRSWS